MKLGEKIRYFRRKAELTQKQLGIMLGFTESNADVRIAQYESGTRKPSFLVMKNMSDKLDVSMYALEAPEIDLRRQNETMHILFALEDAGLIQFTDSGILIDTEDKNFRKKLLQWRKVHSDIADKESYDEWRYRYEE
ncbi:MAG: helix-turn-helix domain-containing protein [Ruminococcus sp.]